MRASNWRQCGARPASWDIRLPTHPVEYTSPQLGHAALRGDNAVAELEVQAALLDGLGQGARGSRSPSCGALPVATVRPRTASAPGFDRVSRSERGLRLVLENDDPDSQGSPMCCSSRIGVPVVWDFLHRHSHDPERIPGPRSARAFACHVAGGVTPKIPFFLLATARCRASAATK